jgi:hypothetical protein
MGMALVGLAWLAGCKKQAPPPALAPAPAPAPAPVQPAEPAIDGHAPARLRPLFLVLYERGLNPAMLDSPSRWRAEYPGSSAAQGPALSPPLLKAAEAAAAETPPLTKLVHRECEQAGVDPATVLKCANDVAQKLGPQEARDVLLTIYLLQAIDDADRGNLHRAHVLLSDVLTEMTAAQEDDPASSISSLRRFFLEVPDKQRFEDFARLFDRYARKQEEKLLVSGEHAAVLRAGGLADAAEFTRERLLTEFDFVTLPLIDLAISRGASYGFLAPAQLQDTRRRLGAHADALKASRPTAPDDSYRTKAELAKDARSAAELSNALGSHQELLAAGCPLAYDADRREFSLPDVWAALGDSGRLGAVAEWCAGKPPSAGVESGMGHFVLGAHWLENRRPDLARMAFVAGAAQLLERAKAVDIAALRSPRATDRAQIATALVSQFNAYRLLMAASLVSASPPGAHVDARDSYLPQLELLLLEWKQAWLKCGLPQKPADTIVSRFGKASEQSRRRVQQEPADRSTHLDNRYFFFDYRFRDGSVPDIFVNKALADGLVESTRLQELATSERFVSFLKGFERPREFSKGFSGRWSDNASSQ